VVNTDLVTSSTNSQFIVLLEGGRNLQNE